MVAAVKVNVHLEIKKKYVFTFTLKIIKDSTAKGGHF